MIGCVYRLWIRKSTDNQTVSHRVLKSLPLPLPSAHHMSVSACIMPPQPSTWTNAHKDPPFPSRLPALPPLTSTLYFNFKIGLFLWSRHQDISRWFIQKLRNRLRKEGRRGIDTEWVRVKQCDGVVSPTLLCSVWTRCLAPTDWVCSHVQLKKKTAYSDLRLFFHLLKGFQGLCRLLVTGISKAEVCAASRMRETVIRISWVPLLLY